MAEENKDEIITLLKEIKYLLAINISHTESRFQITSGGPGAISEIIEYVNKCIKWDNR